MQTKRVLTTNKSEKVNILHRLDKTTALLSTLRTVMCVIIATALLLGGAFLCCNLLVNRNIIEPLRVAGVILTPKLSLMDIALYSACIFGVSALMCGILMIIRHEIARKDLLERKEETIELSEDEILYTFRMERPSKKGDNVKALIRFSDLTDIKYDAEYSKITFKGTILVQYFNGDAMIHEEAWSDISIYDSFIPSLYILLDEAGVNFTFDKGDSESKGEEIAQE